MKGDLLLASRSLTFRYNRAAGPINVADNGSTSIVNSIIGDNNSPLPRDRVAFRYNHFDNAQSVTGFGPAVFDQQGVGTSFAQTRNYNLDRYTFSFEKTFLDDLMSVEMRFPFSTTLSPNLQLSAGEVTSLPGANGQFGVNATPQNTLGNESTQYENMMLIFKGLLWQSEIFALSGGLGVGIPTGADTAVRVIDYSGTSVQGVNTIQRIRDFHIDNETWSLSPFLAFLLTPIDRFFFQGFLEVDFPLNSSTIDYRESTPLGTVPPLPGVLATGPTLQPPFSVRNGISEQPLLHVDLGAGYWVLRDPSRTFLTGIAPAVELHYTTTLKNASVVTLPADGLVQLDPTNPGRLVAESPPQIGNLRNRVDILDMTVGTTFLLAEQATLAVAATVPLRGGDNRTFDWEVHVQLNYFFGGTQRRSSPNF